MELAEALALIETQKADISKLKSESEGFKAERDSILNEREKLLAKRDELLAQIRKLKDVDSFVKSEGLDLDGLKEKLSTIETLQSGDTKQIEERYRTQYEADRKGLDKVRADLDVRIKAIEEEREAEKQKAAIAQKNQDILTEASKQSHRLFNPQQFLLLFGSRVTRDEDSGDLIIEEGYKKTPLATYIESLRENADYQNLFKSDGMNGSGGKTPDQNSGGNTVNPWKAETRNMTEQMRLIKTNPGKAQILAQQAGVTLKL
jgi:hypothetical protein